MIRGFSVATKKKTLHTSDCAAAQRAALDLSQEPACGLIAAQRATQDEISFQDTAIIPQTVTIMISLIDATMNGPIHFQMSCKEMQNAADIAFFLSDRTLSPHVSAAAEVIFPLLLVLTSASSLLVPHHSLVEPSRPKEFLNVCAVGRLDCKESTGFTIDFVNGIDCNKSFLYMLANFSWQVT